MMLGSYVSPALLHGDKSDIISANNVIKLFCVSSNSPNLHRLKKKNVVVISVTPISGEECVSVCCRTAPKLLGGLSGRGFRGVRRVKRQARPPSAGEDEGDQGDKKMQELLVDLLRLETGKVRVDEFVEEKSKFLSEIAEQANEGFDRIAEEALKGMDEAGSKVMEQIDAEAADFEEELAAARAEMEANERDLNEFEKNVAQARSEGLFFKTLFSKPTKPWKAKSPEEQKEVKEKARVVTDALNDGTRKAAGSKFRRTAYAVMIFVLTVTVLEAISSGNVQWTRLAVYILLLVGLVVQLTYETLVSKDTEK